MTTSRALRSWTPELLTCAGKIHPHAVTGADEVGVDAQRRSLARVLRVQFVQVAVTRPRVEHEHLRGRRPAGTRRAEEDNGAQFPYGGLRLGEARWWNETFSQPTQLVDWLTERLEPLQGRGYEV